MTLTPTEKAWYCGSLRTEGVMRRGRPNCEREVSWEAGGERSGGTHIFVFFPSRDGKASLRYEEQSLDEHGRDWEG
jgi:hypothetical protein